MMYLFIVMPYKLHGFCNIAVRVQEWQKSVLCSTDITHICNIPNDALLRRRGRLPLALRPVIKKINGLIQDRQKCELLVRTPMADILKTVTLTYGLFQRDGARPVVQLMDRATHQMIENLVVRHSALRLASSGN